MHPVQHAASPSPRRRIDPLLIATALLLAVLAGTIAWRIHHTADTARDAAARTEPPRVARTWNDATLQVPAEWTVLDRSADHITWGTASRSHTVTLATTTAGVLPLPGVVGAIARDAPVAVRGARLLGQPLDLALPDDAARDDAAMAVRFALEGPGLPARLTQVWRRDSRAGRDVVATWTSRDGRWPVDPIRSVPTSDVR